MHKFEIGSTVLLLAALLAATSGMTTNAACWSTFGGVCVKTGSNGCPFTGAWFSWLHCPVGYHCCVPPKPSGQPIDRHPLVASCGNRSSGSVDLNSDAVAMVIGGAAAKSGDWPWLVQIQLLRQDGNGAATAAEQHCGGALVHPSWVLTAGHCFAWADPRDAFILHVGHTAAGDGSRQTFNVSRVVVHEEFFNPVFSNDIALLRLDRPAVTNALVHPICLPEPGESFDNGVGCVAGWGATSDRGISDQPLMETQLPLVTSARCRDLYAGTGRPVYAENICAGFLAGERDACQGDSGGPLMVLRDSTWLAAGVVSHGEGCAKPSRPGVYTGVANYVAWIRRHVTESAGEGVGY